MDPATVASVMVRRLAADSAWPRLGAVEPTETGSKAGALPMPRAAIASSSTSALARCLGCWGARCGTCWGHCCEPCCVPRLRASFSARAVAASAAAEKITLAVGSYALPVVDDSVAGRRLGDRAAAGRSTGGAIDGAARGADGSRRCADGRAVGFGAIGCVGAQLSRNGSRGADAPGRSN